MNKQVGGEGTVAKAIEIMDIVVRFERAVRFSELLEVCPYPKATLHRFLQTLTQQGLLSYDDDRQLYAPGLHLARMGYRAWQHASLAPVAAPFLDALSAETGETLHLAQMENGNVVFVDKRKARVQFETLARPGRLAPAHCTGVGKIMMALMDEPRQFQALATQKFQKFTEHTLSTREELIAEFETIRDEGLAFDREEHEDGVMSMAAPILAPSGKPIGALSIVTATSRMDLDQLKALRPALTRTTTQIGSEASNWPIPLAN